MREGGSANTANEEQDEEEANTHRGQDDSTQLADASEAGEQWAAARRLQESEEVQLP